MVIFHCYVSSPEGIDCFLSRFCLRWFLIFPIGNPPWLGNRWSEYLNYFLGTPNQQIQVIGRDTSNYSWFHEDELWRCMKKSHPIAIKGRPKWTHIEHSLSYYELRSTSIMGCDKSLYFTWRLAPSSDRPGVKILHVESVLYRHRFRQFSDRWCRICCLAMLGRRQSLSSYHPWWSCIYIYTYIYI